MAVACSTLRYSYDPKIGTTRVDGGTLMVMGDRKAHKIEIEYPSNIDIGDGDFTARVMRSDGSTFQWAVPYASNTYCTDKTVTVTTDADGRPVYPVNTTVIVGFYLPTDAYTVPGKTVFSLQVDSSSSSSTYHDVTMIIIDFYVVKATTSNVFTSSTVRLPSTQEVSNIVDRANRITQTWENATATATTLAAGSQATVRLSETTTTPPKKAIAFGIPQGAKGEKGAKGDTGNTGAAGTRGSQWNVGNKITGTSTTAAIFPTGLTSSLVGDMYFNNDSNNVYQCTTAGNASTAKWKYVGNIQGAQGARGQAGMSGGEANVLTAMQNEITNFAPDATVGSIREAVRRMFIPTGGASGTSGQVLTLTNDAHTDGAVDFFGWRNLPSTIPTGGSENSVLAKASNSDNDVAWQNMQTAILTALTNYITSANNAPDATISTIREAVRRCFIPAWGESGTAGQVLTLSADAHSDGAVDFYGWRNLPNDLPTGGSTGQILTKKSATDYDVKWTTVAKELPTGGANGDVLTKTQNGVEWLSQSVGETDQLVWCWKTCIVSVGAQGTRKVDIQFNSATVTMQDGTTATSSPNMNRTFTSAPVMMGMSCGSSESATANYQPITCWFNSITATGCTVYISNGSNTNITTLKARFWFAGYGN